MASSYASLFCGFFEEDLVFNSARNPHLKYISNWTRYIDDIFFVWSGSAEELASFHSFINTNSCNLKFTMEHDTQTMNFLDILIYRESNKLCSTLYRKSTDRNSILHGKSFHPVSLKRSLPISTAYVASVAQTFTIKHRHGKTFFTERIQAIMNHSSTEQI